MSRGGYESGYLHSRCFWGSEPGTLVRRLEEISGGLDHRRVLDAGCGEGKNAAFLAARGARVFAFDISMRSLGNSLAMWPILRGLSRFAADVAALPLQLSKFDVVIAYGLLHCLASPREILDCLGLLKAHTAPHGYHVLCVFNDRYQDLRPHADLRPCLMPHSFFMDAYLSWQIEFSSDEDIEEIHPHLPIRHRHSLTRILARAPE